jgi:hypothetical protein
MVASGRRLTILVIEIDDLLSMVSIEQCYCLVHWLNITV